jgi:hypothetical protein
MLKHFQIIALVSLIFAVGVVHAWPMVTKPAQGRILKVEDIYFECIKKKPEVILLDLNLNKLRDIQRMSKACNPKHMEMNNEARTVIALGDQVE